jgi:hypothetical protein
LQVWDFFGKSKSAKVANLFNIYRILYDFLKKFRGIPKSILEQEFRCSVNHLFVAILAMILLGCGQPKVPMVPESGEANLSSPSSADKVEQAFTVKRIQDFKLSFKAEDQVLTREMALGSKRTPTTLEFKQVERQLITETHEQNPAILGFGDLGLDKEFSIPVAAAAGTMQVTVNGTLVSSSSYTIDNLKREIVFKTAPPGSSIIKITYRANTALSTSFAIGNFVDSSTLVVKVDGKDSTDFAYDKTTGALVFASAPNDLASVVAQFVKDEGPILEYEIIGATEVDRVVAKADGKAVGFEFALPMLKIDPASHVHDKTVVVYYRDENSNLNEVSLPHVPLEGSLKVETKENCELGKDIVLEDQLLKIDCRIAGAGDFKISYRYNGVENQVFVLDNPHPPDDGKWEVMVNDNPTKDFKRNGNQITLSKSVPEGSVVKVIFTKSAPKASH